MYENFKFLNYYKTNRKLKKLQEMLNRLSGDYEYKKQLIDDLNKQINRMKISIPKPEIIGILPDLTVIDISAIDRGHYLEFVITVKNIGIVATEEETNLVITLAGEEIELTIPILAVNESVDRYVSYPYDPNTENTYSLAVNSEVNEERNIEESDYTNNILEESFTIKENYVDTGIIVHFHNPEGIEIGSISYTLGGALGGSVEPPEIYFNSEYVGTSADSIGEHNIYKPVLSPGEVEVKVIFNNIQSIKKVIAVENIIKVVYFQINRHDTPVIYEGFIEGLYRYRFLFHYGLAVYYNIQNHNPAQLDSIGSSMEYPDYLHWNFYAPQYNLIATTIPYDLTGVGVKG